MTHQPETRPVTVRAAMARGFSLIPRLVRMHPWAFVSAVAGAALFVSAIVADGVVLLENGRIERGSHTELLATAGVYAALHSDWAAGTVSGERFDDRR